MTERPPATRARVRVFIVLFAAAVAVSGCSSPDPRPGPSSSEVVDPRLAAVVAATVPEGARGTLVAAVGDQLTHCAGFEPARPGAAGAASCDTVYDLMSMTKQFTAAAILKLQMQGILSVDDPIVRFFPSAPADKSTITVHQLLTHTAGLVESLGDDYEPLTRDEFLDRAFGSELVSAPGEAHLYSNVGYSLLAAIIEATSGSSYEAFLARELFEPAGMQHTGYVLPAWDDDLVAVEFDAGGDEQGRPFDHPWSSEGPFWNLHGNGGMLSSARDLFLWHVALLGTNVLDADAKAALFEPHVREEPDGESFYSYGWAIQDTSFGRLASHDGGNSWSFGVLARLLDSGVLVFWITNQAVDRAAGVDLIDSASDLTGAAIEELLARAE